MRRHLAQERTIVGDDGDPAGVRPQPGGEEFQPGRVEVVGRLVEQ